MNREDVIKLAQSCGINFHQAGWPELERFAAIVAAAAKAEENEACAKVCEDAPEPDGYDLAERIRERKKNET